MSLYRDDSGPVVPRERGEFVPRVLKELDHQDEKDDRDHHDLGVEALVTVSYRDVANYQIGRASCRERV